ncbi:family 78 glycoside hydrolase catalytic domain [Microbacterium sp. MAH-37]|nr:alpha-L-rhamnosidase N-terminal domain-containing protein [Microbacterium sp. MAH-37]MVQ43060.1 family 78 glycoside hydrolase catalytic domain [Microbacterium sp. MAH-37]
MTAHWTSPSPAREWRAQWIWSERTGLVPPSPTNPVGAHDPSVYDVRVLFRRAFHLDAVPTHALLAATADGRYIAHVNGERVGQGPGRHDANSLTYDEWDVTALLHAGRNVIAVMGRHYGNPVPWWMPSRPSHTMGAAALAVELEADGRVVVATDDRWLVQEAEAWTPAEPQGLLASQPAELFDARRHDPDWTRLDVDDTSWRPATPLREQAVIGPRGRVTPGGEPYGAVLPSALPRLGGDRVEIGTAPLARSLAPAAATCTNELIAALSTDASAGALTVLDAGRVVSGRLRLRLRGRSGDIVRAALVEAVGPAAFESAAPFQIVLDDGETLFEPFDQVGGRLLVLAAAAEGTLPELIAAEVQECHRPRHGASFRCSDTDLQRIVDVSLRTVDLSASDAYLDCPTRERRAWTGDAIVHQSVDLVANADWSLAMANPRLLARPRPDGLLPMAAAGDFASPAIPTIPDWSLHWVGSVHNIYRYAGDRAAVRELLPVVESVLRWFLPFLRQGRLCEVPGWVLIDWSPVQVEGSSAALTALWARALRQFAAMSDWLGDESRRAWAEGLHEQAVAGFEAFWDESRHAYRDNILSDGNRGSGVSEHVAASALLAELVPPHRVGAVRALLRDRGSMVTDSPLADHGSDQAGPSAGRPVWRRDRPYWDTERLVIGAQPFFRRVVHDAVALLGDDLIPLYRDWDRLLDTGPTALRECWEGGSFCHGWSATVARDVIVHTMGIAPAEPGYEKASVRPRLESLAWAEAVVPTPHGDIELHVDTVSLRLRTPVPTVVEWGGTLAELPAGEHTIRNRLA